MDRAAILATLRAHQDDLIRAGIRHAALFGSVARGDAVPGSDIDVMIEFDPAAVPDVFTYAGIKDRIGELLPGRVDVVDRDALRPAVRQNALADLVYAF
ncbi:MAG: polymerase, beta-like region [Rubritepida sp.]|nr:polymerase, beta-like region [Rubritepida sp.]